MNQSEFENKNEDYDPHLHRDSRANLRNLEGLIHIIKAILGSGILAQPLAFKKGGYIIGVFGIFFSSFLYVYTVSIVIKCKYIICKRYRIPYISYSYTTKYALENGPKRLRFLSSAAFYLVDSFLIVHQFGTCVVFTIFISTNIKHAYIHYFGVIDIRMVILALFAPLLFLSLIKSLKILSPISFIANILLFTALAVLLAYALQDLPSLSDRHPFGTFTGVLQYFNTLLFTFRSIGVVLSVESNLKDPKDFAGFHGILSFGVFVIAFTYAFVGFFGYWKYGEALNNTLSVAIPFESSISYITVLALALGIALSFPLQIYVLMDIWKELVENSSNYMHNSAVVDYFVRFLAVFLSTLLALIVPKLSFILGFFGSISVCIVGIIIPPIVEICVLWPNKFGKYNTILIRNTIISLFGLICMICGLYASISHLARSSELPISRSLGLQESSGPFFY